MFLFFFILFLFILFFNPILTTLVFEAYSRNLLNPLHWRIDFALNLTRVSREWPIRQKGETTIEQSNLRSHSRLQTITREMRKESTLRGESVIKLPQSGEFIDG